MKIPRLHLALAGLLTVAGATVATAQFDDVYYDPSDVQEVSSRDRGYTDDYDGDEAYADNTGYDSEFVGGNDAPAEYREVARYGESGFDNQPITSDDYTGYEYSSRIRRFNRPYQGFGYYDPVYVDQYYYDGFGRPVVQTALIYNSPYAYNNAVRFNRFNRFNSFGNPYAFDRFGRRNAFYDPFSPWNDPFYGGASAFGWGSPVGYGAGFNRFGGAGFGGGAFGGGYYCPPTWGNTGVAYNTPNAVTPRASTVAQRGNRSIGSRSTARSTNSNRATVPTRRATTSDDKGRARTSAPSSRTTRSTTPASRSNGRVAPSRSNSRGTTSPSRSSSRSSRSTAPQSRSSRPSYSAPRSSSSNSRSSSRPSYSAPRSSSTRSSTPRSSSSSRSYSSPRSSSSSSRSSGSSSRSSSRSPR